MRGVIPPSRWGPPRLALETADGEVELLSFAACGELTSSKGIPAAGELNETVKGTDFPDQAAVAPYLFASDAPTFTKFFGLPETARRLAETAVGNLAEIAGQEPDDEIPPSSALTAGGGGGFLSNTHNNYLAAAFSRERGNAYVVRAKAPTAGLEPANPKELRYWSFCVNEFASQRFVACSIDEQTPLDGDGFFTFVVSDPEDKPDPLPGDVVWIPWGGAYYDSLVIYRHMLPSVGFGQAIQHVPYWKHNSGGAEDPALGRADPAATMGCYYPRAAYCEADDLAGKVKGQEIFEACFGVGDSASDPFAGC